MSDSGLPDEGRLLAASERAVATLAARLDEQGLQRGTEEREDVGAYYKLPTQLLLGGMERQCNLVLDAIKTKFLQPDGDLVSYPDVAGRERKTRNTLLSYNWPYVNGWTVVAAQRAGRFDVAVPAFRYILKYRNPQTGGFLWYEPYVAPGTGLNQSTCGFMTAHLGYVCLFMGAVDEAKAAGDYLVELVAKQPALSREMLLKTDSQGRFVTEFPADKATFFTVKTAGTGEERYYQLGYPAFFLQRLYLATSDKRYLHTAQAVLQFAEQCGPHLYTYVKSHKVAYGAAAVWSSTHDERYRKLALRIAGNMLSLQADDGLFLPQSPMLERLDQSAENAGWLREIHTELSR